MMAWTAGLDKRRSGLRAMGMTTAIPATTMDGSNRAITPLQSLSIASLLYWMDQNARALAKVGTSGARATFAADFTVALADLLSAPRTSVLPA